MVGWTGVRMGLLTDRMCKRALATPWQQGSRRCMHGLSKYEFYILWVPYETHAA